MLGGAVFSKEAFYSLKLLRRLSASDGELWSRLLR